MRAFRLKRRKMRREWVSTIKKAIRGCVARPTTRWPKLNWSLKNRRHEVCYFGFVEVV